MLRLACLPIFKRKTQVSKHIQILESWKCPDYTNKYRRPQHKSVFIAMRLDDSNKLMNESRKEKQSMEMSPEHSNVKHLGKEVLPTKVTEEEWSAGLKDHQGSDGS